MSIFSRLSESQTQAQQSALAEYVQLLREINIHNPTAEQETRLAGLLDTLGKSPAQSEKDYKRVREVIALEAQSAEFPYLREEYQEASRAHHELIDEHRAITLELSEAMKAACVHKNNAKARADRARSAGYALRAIDIQSELSPKTYA